MNYSSAYKSQAPITATANLQSLVRASISALASTPTAWAPECAISLTCSPVPHPRSRGLAGLGLVGVTVLTGCSSSTTPHDNASPTAAASQGSQQAEMGEPSAEASAEGDQG